MILFQNHGADISNNWLGDFDPAALSFVFPSVLGEIFQQ